MLLVVIDKFRTESGKCPFDEFLQDLINNGREKELAQINTYIKYLRDFGHRLPSISQQYAKFLEDKLYELRPGSNRIIYYFFDGEKIIILHAFKKKTPKTPKKEIEQAKREMKEYERIKKNERAK